MIRAFLAINLPPDEHQAVVEISQELQQLRDAHRIRWVAPGAFHLTLAFLGDIEASQTAMVDSSVSGVIRSSPAFSCGFTGLMSFPSWQRMRVLGIGVSDPAKLLHRLQSEIVSALRSAGFELDKRHFRPHLTLGRVRQRGADEALNRLTLELEAYETGSLTSWPVTEVHLIRSQLGSGPPRYTILESYTLGVAA